MSGLDEQKIEVRECCFCGKNPREFYVEMDNKAIFWWIGQEERRKKLEASIILNDGFGVRGKEYAELILSSQIKELTCISCDAEMTSKYGFEKEKNFIRRMDKAMRNVLTSGNYITWDEFCRT